VASSKSRAPRPTTTGYVNSRYSSTRPAVISEWTSRMLPVATMSLPGSSFSREGWFSPAGDRRAA
jgi:hypothetical protein